MTGLYRIGGKNIRIESIHESVQERCRDYRTEGEPDFTVQTTLSDLAYEQERSDREAEAEGRNAVKWSSAYLEELAVYRKIAEKMPDYDTFLFHGSCVAVDNDGYLFTARSGTGKSTHVRLWREMLGSRAVMVNDDKPLIHLLKDNGAVIYGTPWDGKHRLSSNILVPLRAVCLLERAEENRIAPVTAQEAFPMLIQQTYRPADPAAMIRTMKLIDRLSQSVKLYKLRCNMDISAAELSYGTMKEEA